MVVDALKKNGHQVLPWKPYKHDFAVDLINGIYAADGCAVRLPLPCPPFRVH
jgi:amidase